MFTSYARFPGSPYSKLLATKWTGDTSSERFSNFAFVYQKCKDFNQI